MKTTAIRALTSLGLSLSLLGTATLTHAADPAISVMSIAAQTPELSTFYRLVQQAGLTEALQKGDLTVFAPTDEAFKALPAATLDKLSKDPEALKSVLSYHVVPAATASSKVDGNVSLTTVQGSKLAVSKAGEFITVDDALVIKADLAAGDSVIHEIDRVLMPAIKK
jgi:uncharacterized surface protein with fasciclin (FAS1) repeats